MLCVCCRLSAIKVLGFSCFNCNLITNYLKYYTFLLSVKIHQPILLFCNIQVIYCMLSSPHSTWLLTPSALDQRLFYQSQSCWAANLNLAAVHCQDQNYNNPYYNIKS